ncbi:MAG: hypothetical protein HOI49_01610 [Bacteroidetes bacterium]|jgi:hypothetical protein|nr:hypothetical protein [Bacteroidota bacterium]
MQLIKKRIIASIPILMIGIFVNAQVIKIDTEKKVKDDFFEKSQSILPIYKYTGNQIEPYSKFGLEVDANKPWYTIKKLPELLGVKDTGYTYIYFAGADNAVSRGYLLTLVANYRRSRRTVYFYIDRNNDLDFTNDGAPDSITYKQNQFEITLENSTIPDATYAIKLSRFQYGQNVRYKNLLTEHYKAHSGKKEFTNINYCYREQRYNSVAAHYRSATDSFTIGIKDMNVNGVYNESCTDKLYVGAYKSQIVSDDLFDMVPTISNNAFEWGGKKYRIVSIETSGAYVEIEEDQNAVLSSKLEIGEKAPNFTYFNVFNKKHQLREYRKQEIFLFFWDKETLTSEDTLYLNKLNTEYPELKLVTLNHGDEPKQVKIIYYYDKVKYPMGYSNSDIAAQYFLEDVSRGYYLGKRRRLKNDNLSPKEMYELLQNTSN